MLFDPTRYNQKQLAVPQLSAVKIRNQQREKESSEEYMSILKYLAESLKADNLKPEQFFMQADKQMTRVLRVDQLKDHVKASLLNKFDGLNFMKLAVALNINNTGIVYQNEFVQLMQRAAQSGADTSQFHRIVSAISGSPAKVKKQ